MNAEQPKVSPTGRYSITQTAILLGVHRNTVRNWFMQGKFNTGEYKMRMVNGRPFIKGSAIQRLWHSERF